MAGLRNFLDLRLSTTAHFEIRELAKQLLMAVPEDHKFLFASTKEG